MEIDGMFAIADLCESGPLRSGCDGQRNIGG